MEASSVEMEDVSHPEDQKEADQRINEIGEPVQSSYCKKTITESNKSIISS